MTVTFKGPSLLVLSPLLLFVTLSTVLLPPPRYFCQSFSIVDQRVRHSRMFRASRRLLTTSRSETPTGLSFIPSRGGHRVDGPLNAMSCSIRVQTKRPSSVSPDSVTEAESSNVTAEFKPAIPLYLSEGLFAVRKPLEWTSSDVVSYIRGIIERDARLRGARPVGLNSRRNKGKIVRVGTRCV